MKVAVIGPRNADPDILRLILHKLPAGCSEIISGGAYGIDSAVKKAAGQLHLKYTCIRPRFNRYGRVARLYRNSMIVDKADCVFAFWDGRSHATRQAIALCIERRKPFQIYLIKPHNILTKKSD